MIVGLGTDIVEIARIEKALVRFGRRFSNRILSPVERAGVLDARFLAKRFAAKEAVAKALGTGIRWPVIWHQMVVDHDDLGRPVLIPGSALSSWLIERRIGLHLSVADEKHYSVATAVAEITS